MELGERGVTWWPALDGPEQRLDTGAHRGVRRRQSLAERSPREHDLDRAPATLAGRADRAVERRRNRAAVGPHDRHQRERIERIHSVNCTTRRGPPQARYSADRSSVACQMSVGPRIARAHGPSCARMLEYQVTRKRSASIRATPA